MLAFFQAISWQADIVPLLLSNSPVIVVLGFMSVAFWLKFSAFEHNVEKEFIKVRNDMENGLKDVRSEIKDLRNDMENGFKDVRAEIKDVRNEMQAGFKDIRTEMREGFTKKDHQIEKIDAVLKISKHTPGETSSNNPKSNPHKK
jgi:biopolymer transport protein ExbB/TolQ